MESNKLNLNIMDFMDFPMILNTLDYTPSEINLTIVNINKKFILDTLKYLRDYSINNNIKINLIDKDGVID